jgi:hypothetical protein
VARRASRVELRSIAPDATPEEVAAITAAITVSVASLRRAPAGDAAGTTEEGSTWVNAARLTARRGAYSRGAWRLSGRLGRRSRA